MIWLIAGIIPPFLYSIINHVDKFFLLQSRRKSYVDVLIIYSTWFSIIVLPVTYFFARHELFANPSQIIIQLIGGVLTAFSIYFYLKALFKDEASIVIPLLLLVPVFGYLFSYIILGETLSSKQILSCVLVLAGALILSIEIKEETRFKLNHGVLFIMFGCTALQAMQETLFKFATIQNSFIVSVFWMHAGIAFFGLFLTIFKKNAFKNFLETVRKRGKIIFGFNLFAELVVFLADIIRNYALLLAPVVVIMTLNGFQPVFVFILGTLFTVFAPKLVKEKIKPIHLIHKGVAIAIMVTGAILIAQTI